MDQSSEHNTTVIGCAFTLHDLQFVRFEYCALISIAFDLPGRVILYTKKVEQGIVEDYELTDERAVLERVLGGLWNEECFGIHELSGGAFETVIPEQRKKSPQQDHEEEFEQWFVDYEEAEISDDSTDGEGVSDDSTCEETPSDGESPNAEVVETTE